MPIDNSEPNYLIFPTIIPYNKWTFAYPTLKTNHKVKREILVKIGETTVGYINTDLIKWTSGKCRLVDSLTGADISTFTFVDKQMDGLKTVTSDSIFTVLFKLYPWLRDSELSNVMVAGGALSTIIQNLSMGQPVHSYDIHDVDLFMYGMDSDQCKEKVVNLITVLKKFYPKASIIHTQRALTLVEEENKIQIILCSFLNHTEVLQSFDLPSSMVGVMNFQKPTLVTTNKGFFSLTHRVNIVDPKCTSDLYAERLVKYFHRGYSIAFPHLNVKPVPEQTIKLASLTLKLTSVSGNQLEGQAHVNESKESTQKYSYDGTMSLTKSIEQFMFGHPCFTSKITNFTTGTDALNQLAELPIIDPKKFVKYLPEIYKNDCLDLKIFETIVNFDYQEFMTARKQGTIDDYLYEIYYQPEARKRLEKYRKEYMEFAKMKIEPYGPNCHLFSLRNRDTSLETWYREAYEENNYHYDSSVPEIPVVKFC